MKRILFVFLLFVCQGCYFNATLSNEKSQKKKGEEVADMLYEYIEKQQYNGGAQSFLSDEMLKVNSAEEFDSILSSIAEEFGNYRNRSLEDWSTKRREGSNSHWKCTLIYSVDYDNMETKEILNLIKRNDSVKILNYNIKAKNYKGK